MQHIEIYNTKKSFDSAVVNSLYRMTYNSFRCFEGYLKNIKNTVESFM